MRVINDNVDLIDGIKSAAIEAKRAFGSDSLFIEKLISPARHIEIQIIGDRNHNCIHLFERDCSLQRKHQKVLEFSPAININKDLLDKLFSDSVRLGTAANLSNAATVEFLIDPQTNQYYFIEANPRLQVEHTVTEEITNTDIVELQINSSLGFNCPVQSSITRKGFSIQARVCAETPEEEFTPSTGRIQALSFPHNIRCDQSYLSNSDITNQFDSLIAKIISLGTSWVESKAKLIDALKSSAVKGVNSNLGLLISILESDLIESKDYSTSSLEKHISLIDKARIIKNTVNLTLSFLKKISSLNLQKENPFQQSLRPKEFKNFPIFISIPQLNIELKENLPESIIEAPDNTLLLITSPNSWFNSGEVELMTNGYFVRASTSHDLDLEKLNEDIGEGELHAPLPCQIIDIFVEVGEQVESGQKLISFESMKTEYSITAPFSGKIIELKVEKNTRVAKGEKMIQLSKKQASGK